ncbi:MAG TPA: hypothetical protein VLA11_01715 [Woeseiaceae bacterium]|jgi:hypothetical protein|nr:hypothetical protein [Woeseiaceae bacterium]
MLREFAKSNGFRTRRRAAAVLLAAFLNLALLPCSMAFEVVEEAHDCCPPTLELNPSECCEVADANVGQRGGKLDIDLDPDFEPAPVRTATDGNLLATRYCFATVGPPDRPARAVSLHKLNCVFLN